MCGGMQRNLGNVCLFICFFFLLFILWVVTLENVQVFCVWCVHMCEMCMHMCYVCTCDVSVWDKRTYMNMCGWVCEQVCMNVLFLLFQAMCLSFSLLAWPCWLLGSPVLWEVLSWICTELMKRFLHQVVCSCGLCALARYQVDCWLSSCRAL